jgi:hypothetical protein
MGEPEKNSIQSRGRGDKPIQADSLLIMAVAGEQMPRWWSQSRDTALRNFWKMVDTLAGAIYVMESKMSTIPVHVEARDKTISAHVKQADLFTYKLLDGSEFGKGWGAYYEPTIEDLVTQDNGCFSEVIGDGPVDGPIEGAPLSIAHLDASRCTRTGQVEFPVVYRDEDSKYYKLHYSRVLDMAQMPSPIVTMRGVGFCAVSRCTNIAQNLLDIMVYKQEKLGSRPMRSIITTSGGLDPLDIQEALRIAKEEMSNRGLKRYAPNVVIGSKDVPNAKIDITDLASLPDGYNEEQSITLAMAAIALAFGMDARELWPAMSSGATKAEALVQHLKQRGKGPGHILEMTTRGLEQKFLPPHLKAVFDFQDDEQDREIAEIKEKRQQMWKIGLDTKAMNLRTIREQMLSNGDLEKAQFIKQELEDGRLEDGTSVLTLFYDASYGDLLSMGDENVTDVSVVSNPTMIEQSIKDKKLDILKRQAVVENYREKARLDNAMAALNELEKTYKGDKAPVATEPLASAPNEAGATLSADENMTPDAKTEMNVQGETSLKERMNKLWMKLTKATNERG